MQIEDITVTVVIRENRSMIAQVNVTFDGVATKAWRIMHSSWLHPRFQEMISIKPPSYRIGNQWREYVFVEDKELYVQLEDKIYDTYLQAKRNSPPYLATIERKEVKAEDIPL